MKKIVLPILLLLNVICYAQYNPSLHTVTNKAIGFGQATPGDARSMYFDATLFVYRPYQNITEVKTYLNLAKYRTGNFIIVVDSGGILQINGTYVGGHNTFWMFKDSTADANLVELNLLGSGAPCAGCLLASNNLSDVSNAGLARSNLGLGSMSQQNIAAGGTNLSGNWPDPVVLLLNGQPSSFYLDYNNLANKPPQLNPTGAGLVSITGVYPNLTFTGNTPTFEQTIFKNNATSRTDSINLGAFVFRYFGTSALGLPTGNTAQRPGTPATGDTRYNTDSLAIETWNGSIWTHPTGGGGGSGITALTGDGTASGTGSVPFTLATVNSNVFGSNTFLKFAVNGKGLTTSATAVVSGDITGALGYTPYNSTNPNGYIPLTALSVTNSGPQGNATYNNTTGVFNIPNYGADTVNSITGLSTLYQNSLKQNQLSGTGYAKFAGTTPSYLTPTQVTADLNLFTTSLQGLAPASGGGTTNFLRADGTWAAPTGTGGTVTSVALSTPSFLTTSGSPITTAGTFTVTLANQAANTVFGNHTGGSAAPTFGKVVLADQATNTANYIQGWDGSGNPTALPPDTLFVKNRVSGTGVQVGNISSDTLYLNNLVGGTGIGLVKNPDSTININNTIGWDATLTNDPDFHGNHTSSFGSNTWIINESGANIPLTINSVSNSAIRAVSQSSTGITGESNTGYGGYFQNTPATTNTTEYVAGFSRHTSGTGANGIAGAMTLETQDNTAVRRASSLIWKWTNATDASRTSEFSVTTFNNAVEGTVFALGGDGTATLNTYGLGNHLGIKAYRLAVTSAGKIIEDTSSSGGGVDSTLLPGFGIAKSVSTTNITVSVDTTLSYYLLNPVTGLNNKLVADGNSNSIGTNIGGLPQSYPRVSWRELDSTLASYTYFNGGVSGQTTQQMTTNAPTVIDTAFDGTKTKNYLYAWEIENDAAINTGLSSLQLQTNMNTYYTARNGVGWKTIGATGLPRTALTGTDSLLKARIDSANLALVNSHTSLYLIDFRGNPWLNNNRSRAGFGSDWIHMNTSGTLTMADSFTNVVKRDQNQPVTKPLRYTSWGGNYVDRNMVLGPLNGFGVSLLANGSPVFDVTQFNKIAMIGNPIAEAVNSANVGFDLRPNFYNPNNYTGVVNADMRLNQESQWINSNNNNFKVAFFNPGSNVQNMGFGIDIFANLVPGQSSVFFNSAFGGRLLQASGIGSFNTMVGSAASDTHITSGNCFVQAGLSIGTIGADNTYVGSQGSIAASVASSTTFGFGNTQNASNSIIIGNVNVATATSTDGGSIIIGQNNTDGGFKSIIIANTQQSNFGTGPTADGQCIIGDIYNASGYKAIKYFTLGGNQALNATIQGTFAPITLTVAGVAGGGSNTNLSAKGNEFRIYGSVGTGNATGGEIVLGTAQKGASGTTRETIINVLRVDTNQNVNIGEPTTRNFGLNVNRSISIHKDSIPHVTPTAAMEVLVMDTTGGGQVQVKRITIPTSTNIYNTDGTLTANRTLSGGNFSLALGTSGSKLSGMTVWSTQGLSLTGGQYNNSGGSQLLESTSTINNPVTAASGTVSNFSAYLFSAPTITSTNASITYTTPATLRIDNAPTMSTNSTASGGIYALDVAAGISHFGVGTSNFSAVMDGTLYINGATKTNTVALGLSASASNQATLNIPNGVDPSTGGVNTASGNMWYNGTNLYFVDGTGTGVARDLLAGISNYTHTIFTPATGNTISLTKNQYNIVNPSGAIATLTVNMPSSPNNNDVVYIKFTQTVTTVTYANGTVVDGIAAPTAGSLVVLTYDSGTTSWY